MSQNLLFQFFANLNWVLELVILVQSLSLVSTMRYADRAAKIDEEMRMVLSLAPVEQIMFRKQKKVKLKNQ